MAPKREGPFEIEDVLGPVTYQLKLPESWKIHKVFHVLQTSFSLTHADHAFSFYFSSMIEQTLTIRQTCLLHMHILLLPYDLHVFAS